MSSTTTARRAGALALFIFGLALAGSLGGRGSSLVSGPDVLAAKIGRPLEAGEHGGLPNSTAPTPPLPRAQTSTTPCPIAFSDVHGSDYFYAAVQNLACRGVVSGYADNTYRPYNNTTRGQMVKIVVGAFRVPGYVPPSGATFADVPPSQPFAAFIESAAHAGIVNGYVCGGPGEPCDGQNRPYFRPAANVTRGQLSKITVLAAGWPLAAPANAAFADVAPDSAFYAAVETAACHGIVSGYTCGAPGEPCDSQNRPYFRQYTSATRGQIAKIVDGAVTSTGACIFPTPAPSVSPVPTVSGACPLFPADNIWNRPVAALPTHTLSNAYISAIGANAPLHADFGSGLYNGEPIGIPFVTVTAAQPFVPIHFTAYGSESDPGPYPVPTNAPIEGGPASTGDRHVLVVDQGNCTLYEMGRAFPQADGSWNADGGALWHLPSNLLRSAGWTSADAAGLPILPGLVRYDEVAGGVIRHAIRFTVSRTQRAYLWPARHFASSLTDPNLPPMGLRMRLKATVDISGYPAQARVVLQALKDYGMFLADNGSPWYISGAPDDRWNNDFLHQMGNLHGSDFEAVDESGLMIDPNSGQSR